MLDKFAIFILTHGRPNSQLTLDLLRRLGYSGDYYLVVDSQDKTLQEYINNFGATNILVFDKNAMVRRTDTGTSSPVFGCGVYARNAIEYMAKKMGYTMFAQADDDILNFRIRYPIDGRVCSFSLDGRFDEVLSEYIKFASNENIAYIGFGNAPAYMGGEAAYDLQSVNFPYAFMIRNGNVKVDWKMNFSDDYATPVSLGVVGKLCLQVPFVQIDESPVAKVTGNVTGGMVNSYKNQSEVKRAFYMKMIQPDSLTITQTETGIQLARHGRKLRPKILSGRCKK